jgi:hypothetical protein
VSGGVEWSAREDGRRARGPGGTGRARECPPLARFGRHGRARATGSASTRTHTAPTRVILVDTSVWIGHLRASDARLVALLLEEQVLAHPFVIPTSQASFSPIRRLARRCRSAHRRACAFTLPCSCPLGAPAAAKRSQTPTQREGHKSADSIGDRVRSGRLKQQGAKGSQRFFFRPVNRRVAGSNPAR